MLGARFVFRFAFRFKFTFTFRFVRDQTPRAWVLAPALRSYRRQASAAERTSSSGWPNSGVSATSRPTTKSVFETSMFTAGSAAVRASEFRRAWDDPSVSGDYPRSRWIRERAVAAAIRRMAAAAGAEGVCRIQRQHLASDLADMPVWYHGAPWADDRGRLLAEGPERYDAASFLALSQGRGAGLELRPEGLSVLQPGEASGLLFGGTLTQLVASLGYAVRVRSARGMHSLHRGRERAAVSNRSHADAALACRCAAKSAGGLCSARCAAATSPRERRPRETQSDPSRPTFPDRCCSDFPSGHTSGPLLDAAARRQRVREDERRASSHRGVAG